MAVVLGSHTCANCNKVFEWEYQLRKSGKSQIYDVYTIEKGHVYATRLNSVYASEYELSAYCPFCGEFNTFSDNSHISEE